MKASTGLRLTSMLALVQGIAHGALHVSYTPRHGPLEESLVANMKAESFLFGGFDRTYWGFYFGYGLMAVVTCVVQAAAIWLVAGLARSRPREAIPLVLLYAAAYAVHGLLAWHYFFAKPVVFDVLIALGLAASAFLAGAEKSPNHRPSEDR